MHHVLVIGAGKIGSLVAYLLSQSKNYDVHLGDNHKENIKAHRSFKTFFLDANDQNALSDYIKKNKIEALVSCLPFYCNIAIAKVAAAQHIHYFDLTEDVHTTEAVTALAKKSSQKNVFVPQCGLAPGFISIITHHLMHAFDTLDTVKMRVGALPTSSSNALQYSLTWSTDGLINEYGNVCHVIEHGKPATVLALEGLEEITIDGLVYEAFNTSGGIGSLAQTYEGKVQQLSYKTIRYPGHCAKIKFLMNDLKLNEDRETLKHIIEHAIPKTFQDVVLVYVSVNGMHHKQFIEQSYVRKFYPKILGKMHWSAIQLTTASSACSVIDLVLHHPQKYQGLVLQEQFSFDEFIDNEFGHYFKLA
jgi:saccharopine dehydrogenase-like NADP-dependent oxidoreductase